MSVATLLPVNIFVPWLNVKLMYMCYVWIWRMDVLYEWMRINSRDMSICTREIVFDFTRPETHKQTQFETSSRNSYVWVTNFSLFTHIHTHCYVNNSNYVTCVRVCEWVVIPSAHIIQMKIENFMKGRSRLAWNKMLKQTRIECESPESGAPHSHAGCRMPIQKPVDEENEKSFEQTRTTQNEWTKYEINLMKKKCLQHDFV